MPIGALGQAGQHAFQLIRRLRDELKVNTICGASTSASACPTGTQVTGTFLAMAIGAGMTSAIMNPMHPEVKAAVMAADVLAGQDKDCAAWIRANRDPTRRLEPSATGRRRRRSAVGPDAPNRLHPFRLDRRGRHRHHGVGRGAPARGRPRFGVRRSGHLRTLPDRAVDGLVRQVGDRQRTPTALSDWSSVEVDYETRATPAARYARVAASAVQRRFSPTRHRRAVREPGAQAGGAQGPSISPVWSIDPQFTLFNVDVPKAVLGDSESVTELIGEAVAAHSRRRRAHVEHDRARAPLTKPQRTIDGSVTIAVDRDGVAVAIWPGFVDTALGVAIDVGSTTVAGHLCDLSTGEVLATAGMMNPQIRFGEDLMSRVSYVMMNPGGDKELTACIRAALNDLITDLLATSRRACRRVARHRDRRQPDHASHRAGHRPDAARSGTVHAGHRRGDPHDGARPRPRRSQRHAPSSVRASPATSAPTPPRRCSPKARTAARNGSCWSTSAPTPRSCSAAPSDNSPASSPTGPAFEGAQISLRPARHGRCHRTRPHRPRHARAAFKVIGCDLWSDDPGFAAATEDLTISGVCGSGIIEVIGEMYLAGVIDSEGVVRGENAERARTSSPTTARSAMCSTAPPGRVVDHSERRTGDPTCQGGAACRHRSADGLCRRRCARRHALGRRLRRPHRSAVRTRARPGTRAPVEAVRSVGNAAGAGAVRALLSMQARPSSKQPRAPSSRSKPPPSHSSRSCSSQPWPSRTPPHHRRISAPWSRCPNELHLSMPLGAVDAADRRTGHEFH